MGQGRKYLYALFAASALAAGCQQGQRPTLLDEGKTISGKAVEILEEIDTLPNKDLILKGNLPLYEKGLEVRKFGGYDILTYHARSVSSDYLETALEGIIANTNIEDVSTIRETNQLIIKAKSRERANPDALEQMVSTEELEDILKALDRKAPQIMVQASIVRVFADYTDDLRAAISARSKDDTTLPTLDVLLKGAELRSPERLTFGGGYGIVGEIGSYTLRVALNQLESLGYAEDIASPTLVLSNREKARTSRTQEIPIPEEIIVGSSILRVNKYKIVENFLEVEASARDEGEIYLSIKAGVGAVSPSGPTQIPSIITRQTEISGVRLKQGETLVVAGFLDTTNFAVERKAPPFSEIPLLGKLFNSRDIEKRKDIVLFLVTPWYLDPLREIEKEAEEKLEEKPEDSPDEILQPK